MPKPATGDSTAEIYGRLNDRAWAIVFPMLQAGAALRREPTGYYYAEGRGGLTPARIKRLERDGVLRRIGVDTYALAECRS